MTKETRPVAPGLAGVLAFFTVVLVVSLVGLAVNGAHRGAWSVVGAVAFVGAAILAVAIRRSWLARRAPA